MVKKYLISIICLTGVFVSGCIDSYDFSKKYQLTNIDEGKGYNAIELGGMGKLQLADGSVTNDSLIIRKYKYNTLPIYYRFLYEHYYITEKLSPKRLAFRIDGQRYILTLVGSETSDNYELGWVIIEPSFLEKIALAKEVLLSVEGSDKTIDYAFNKRYLYCFKRFYKELVLPDK